MKNLAVTPQWFRPTNKFLWVSSLWVCPSRRAQGVNRGFLTVCGQRLCQTTSQHFLVNSTLESRWAVSYPEWHALVAREDKPAPDLWSAALCLVVLCHGVCPVMSDATCSSAARCDPTEHFTASWNAFPFANGRTHIWGAKKSQNRLFPTLLSSERKSSSAFPSQAFTV